jgi:hypothetical protein
MCEMTGRAETRREKGMNVYYAIAINVMVVEGSCRTAQRADNAGVYYQCTKHVMKLHDDEEAINASCMDIVMGKVCGGEMTLMIMMSSGKKTMQRNRQFSGPMLVDSRKWKGSACSATQKRDMDAYATQQMATRSIEVEG